ncbi:MAG TPA: hypothetical protein VFP97_12590 [Chitinophagaceae bacterium]|nr:hypothetical protein [Chitinophagaceae bacterium]
MLFSIINGEAEEELVFTKVETEATTNPKAWTERVRTYSQLPDSISKEISPGTYKVNVRFIIDKHGFIGLVKASNDPGYLLAKRQRE